MPATFWARTDSNNANNPALNLTGDPAVEIVFVALGPNGDIFLDATGGGIDPNTQVVIDGTSYDFIFELSATLPTLKKDGSQQVPDQYEGSLVYTITVQDYPTSGETTRLTFMPNESATQAEMDAFGNGAVDLQNVDTPSTGVVCFSSGTHILTPRGEIPVNELKVGDHVITLDHGPKPILWISTSRHVWPGSSDKELPILISSGTFGPNAPRRDLIVSPQHKILLSLASREDCSNVFEVLAPAKGMTEVSGVRCMKGKREVVYYHMLLEDHEVLVSEGVASESFFPGPTALGMLRPQQREEIFALFPDLREIGVGGYGSKARKCLTVSEAKTVVKDADWNTNMPLTQLDNIESQRAA